MKYIFRLIPVLLFLSYYLGVTEFSHTHIVDGVKTTHSHPFSSDNEHQHSKEAFQLISHLSALDFSTISHSFDPDIVKKICFELFFETNSIAHSSLDMYCLFRRPPPFLS